MILRQASRAPRTPAYIHDLVKRAFDLATSLIALVILLPVFGVVAACIVLDDRGPVFFRQARVGLKGKPFRIWKFRTMVCGAPGANVSPSDDPRVTRVGRFLRHWYLDELPQMINVLRGDMSFVGPRPETPEFVELYSVDEREILRVRPGVLGPSTLAFMDEAAILSSGDSPSELYERDVLHERVRLDLGYLEHSSLLTDVGLIIRQAVAIFGRHR
jgi:lipopolysaccharide/colanic/teichoic acid biosynthesis glycosyltransferase